MKFVLRKACVVFGLASMIAVGQAAWSVRVAAQEAKSTPSKSSRSSSDAPQETVKIEPYVGDPIYLDEVEQIAKPTVVTRETLKENFEDQKTMRVEREIARYSDNSFAADGKYLEYHPSGKPFIEGQFKAGRHEGTWTYYFENGQVNRKVVYHNGKLDGAWEVHHADGSLAAKRAFKDGLRDGEWVTFDATGKQPLAEEHYVNGKKDGVWKVWFPNGQQKQQLTYKLGNLNGLNTEWNDKGQKLIEANFADDKLNGTATRYLPDGKTITQTYKDGKLQTEAKQLQ